MRRYVITCEFHRAKQASRFGHRLRSLVSEWEQPLARLWLVTTPLTAGDCVPRFYHIWISRIAFTSAKPV